MSRDGTRMAAVLMDSRSGQSSQIAVYDATSGKQTALCAGHRDVTWALTFSPDGSMIASGAGGDDPTARLWDAMNGKLIATCQGHRSKLDSAAFSPDGSRLVTSSSDRTVRQLATRTGQESSRLMIAIRARFTQPSTARRSIRRLGRRGPNYPAYGAPGAGDVAVLHSTRGDGRCLRPSGSLAALPQLQIDGIAVGYDTAGLGY